MADRGYDRVVLTDGAPLGVPQSRSLMAITAAGDVYVPSDDGRTWVLSRSLGGGGVDDPLTIGTINVTDHLSVAESDGTQYIDLSARENGAGYIKTTGDGAQLFVIAGSGSDASHVGGELTLQSGGSQGADGGQILITSGADIGGGNSGDIIIKTGVAVDAGDGGSTGDIEIRVSPDTEADFHGGNVLITGGPGAFGGGHVTLQSGGGSGGTPGRTRLYSADGNQGFEIHNGGAQLLGAMIADSLPTSDPHAVGEIWAMSGTITTLTNYLAGGGAVLVVSEG